MLYHGLTDDSVYQDREGNPTNALGHLIEEYQYGENANPSVLLEALWLLANPMEYRQHVLSLAQKETHKETFRDLKSSEQERITSSNKTGDGDGGSSGRGGGLKRNGSRNIFTRTE